MKKAFFTALVALLFSATAFAINNEHSYYGVTVNSNLNIVDNGKPCISQDDVFPMVGFDLGFYMQQQLYQRFVLVSGLKYSLTLHTESRSIAVTDGYDYSKSEINRYILNHALTIPVKFGYTGDLPRNWTYTVFAGPSLQFNVATTAKDKYDNGNYEKVDFVNGKYKSNYGEDRSGTNDEAKLLKCFDIPLGLGATFHHKFVGIKFEYECGLINRYKGEDKNIKWHSHQISLGVVFSF